MFVPSTHVMSLRRRSEMADVARCFRMCDTKSFFFKNSNTWRQVN